MADSAPKMRRIRQYFIGIVHIFCSAASSAIRQKASSNPEQGLILMAIKPGRGEKFGILVLDISTR
jgi:hypothetical protein